MQKHYASIQPEGGGIKKSETPISNSTNHALLSPNQTWHTLSFVHFGPHAQSK